MFLKRLVWAQTFRSQSFTLAIRVQRIRWRNRTQLHSQRVHSRFRETPTLTKVALLVIKDFLTIASSVWNCQVLCQKEKQILKL